MDRIRNIPIPDPIAKAARPILFYFVCAWVAIALFAYGLALRKYAFEMNTSRTQVNRGGAGRVGWVRVSRLSFFPVQFTLEGNPALYFVPAEFITPSAYKELSDLLQRGSLISMSTYDTMVVGLTLNPRTALEKNPVPWLGWNNLSPTFYQHIAHALAVGLKFIFAGLLLLPTAWFARRFLLKRKAS